MNEVTFTIKATMEERWVNDFISCLKRMEHCGKIGKSEIVSFYADGDGDFRPLFEVDINYEVVSPIIKGKQQTKVYDAG